MAVSAPAPGKAAKIMIYYIVTAAPRFRTARGAAPIFPYRQVSAMNVLVIDAQGGGIGKQLVAVLKKELPGVLVTAVGANSLATSAMLRAGADQGATGENAVVVNCRKADVIMGPVGIVIADALWGEITPAMALAVGQSAARRVLIPINHCDNVVVGVPDTNVGRLIREAVAQIREFCSPAPSP